MKNAYESFHAFCTKKWLAFSGMNVRIAVRDSMCLAKVSYLILSGGVELTWNFDDILYLSRVESSRVESSGVED